MDYYRYVISKTNEIRVVDTKITKELWAGLVGNYAMGFSKKQLIKVRDEINKLLKDMEK